MKKQKLKNKRGITLIALVVTIVVLLILAGVSISMLTGDNGIITQTQAAKENTRGAEVKEYVDMVANENKIIEYSNGTKKTKQYVINKLVEDKKLTDEEIELLETIDVITIGEIEIDFSILEKTTIGSIYTEKMIGKAINYVSDTELPEGNNWIILGKDNKDGSIVLTTSKPIENGVTVNYTVDGWLKYEEDLKTACEVYGTTIQGKTITARSITLEDINNVTGFIEPEFKTYTFGATYDWANQKVDFYHPDSTVEGKWSINETTYQDNAYHYYIDANDNSVKYGYRDTEFKDANYTESTLKNMNIIVGNSSEYSYSVSSRSVCAFEEWNQAFFNIASVSGGKVDSDSEHYVCKVESKVVPYDYGGSESKAIRPIVNIPSNIQVENINGEISIVE